MPLTALTDADVLADLQWRHTEDASFSSGLWTLAEVANYLTERQNAFNRSTGFVLARALAVAVDANSKATLPADWVSTHRVTYRSAAGRTFAVPRSDRFSDYMLSIGATIAPLAHDDHSGGTRVLELLPPLFPSGTLDLLYVSTLQALALNPLAPITFSVPFDFVPYIVYGAMSDMLAKSGRGQDLERARYCEQRFAEGIAVATLLQEGFA